MFLLSPFLIYSQPNADRMGNKVYIRVVGSPSFELTKIAGNTAMLAGGHGTLLFNDRFEIGGYLKYKINSFNSTKVGYSDASVGWAHFGLTVGAYLYKEPKIIDPVFMLDIGVGYLAMKQPSGDSKDWTPVITPNIIAERKLSNFVRVGIGVNYALSLKMNGDIYSNSDASGPGVFAIVKVGIY
jgi:hypothetical protein